MHVKFKGNSIFEELKHPTCCHSLIIKYFGLVKRKEKCLLVVALPCTAQEADAVNFNNVAALVEMRSQQLTL